MAKEKKSKSIEEIISDMQSVREKGFKERISKFEEFHKPEAQHGLKFAQHAEYIVFGKPSDMKAYPGAYNVAYNKLDSILKEDEDKLKKEDDILNILEAYVDSFLDKAMGAKFKEAMDLAKKEELSDDEIRDMKNTLIAHYIPDEKFRGYMQLSKDSAKQHKGKTKLEMIAMLKGVGQKLAENYAQHLMGKATEGLIKHYDIVDLTKYVKPKFEEAGFKPEDHYLTMHAQQLAAHYGALISGMTDQLVKEHGYKKVTKEKKENKEEK